MIGAPPDPAKNEPARDELQEADDHCRRPVALKPGNNRTDAGKENVDQQQQQPPAFRLNLWDVLVSAHTPHLAALAMGCPGRENTCGAGAGAAAPYMRLPQLIPHLVAWVGLWIVDIGVRISAFSRQGQPVKSGQERGRERRQEQGRTMVSGSTRSPFLGGAQARNTRRRVV